MSNLTDQRARAQRLIGQAVAMLAKENGGDRERATYQALRSAAIERAEIMGHGVASACLTDLAVEFAEGVKP